jgi:hypothetical protein
VGKRPEREAEDSPPSSAGTKRDGAVSPPSNMSWWFSAHLGRYTRQFASSRNCVEYLCCHGYLVTGPKLLPAQNYWGSGLCPVSIHNFDLCRKLQFFLRTRVPFCVCFATIFYSIFYCKCWVGTQIPRCSVCFTCSPPNGNFTIFV